MSVGENPPFDFAVRTRIVFGAGSMDRLGAVARECGGRRVLLVTDAGIVRAGHVARARALLEAAGLTVLVFDQVIENPTTTVVDDCVSAARNERIDCLVGLGGGSSLDVAKGCNFLFTGGGRMEDYWGVGKAKAAMLPLVAVPTTAGTGSECQSVTLISQEETHVKMACGDPRAAPTVAILDPELTLTLPAAVAATTAMDALSHALESAVSKRRSPLSQMLSSKAFRLCTAGLAGTHAEPDDVAARGQILLGAALAGLAIENSMLGAAHAAANPLSARHGLTHGHAVGLMLAAVVRYNSTVAWVRPIYRQLAGAAELPFDDCDSAAASEALAAYLERFQQREGLPRTLAEAGVWKPDLEGLAQDATRQWTAQFNPRSVGPQGFAAMYRAVSGREPDDGPIAVTSKPTRPRCE